MGMNPIPVIGIFDIGKTNKKFFLFNEQYQIVLEESVQFAEIVDEDGFACDDLPQLTGWIKNTFAAILQEEKFIVKAVNVSAYGASFVHIDKNGKPVTVLYNYLKPFPEALQKNFYANYGGVTLLSAITASPVLGSLNSGLQLYRIKKEQPGIFQNICWSLHLPQYISFLLSGKTCAELTSIGCHTLLWNFSTNRYHDWVYEEGLIEKFPPIEASDKTVDVAYVGKKLVAGMGLHDSSSALIPYLACFTEPFILLSTGTWCISLNPFNDEALTEEELANDCLCYLQYNGRQVKASRLFAGNEHETQTKKLAAHFNVPADYWKELLFQQKIYDCLCKEDKNDVSRSGLHHSAFEKRELAGFENFETAYHQLIADFIRQQVFAIRLVIPAKKPPRIFVDGGFAKNDLYMKMLAIAFPEMDIYAASVAQATALGAALAIHPSWNNQKIPEQLITLKKYTS